MFIKSTYFPFIIYNSMPEKNQMPLKKTKSTCLFEVEVKKKT
jgi:hypothetical protein